MKFISSSLDQLSGRLFAAVAVVVWCGGLADVRAAQPLPAKVSGGAKPGLTTIPLGRGHLNRLCLAAAVEGIKGLMILDTGASLTLLNEAKYGAMHPGPDRKLPSGVPTTVSVNGTRAPVTLVHEFRVGGTDLGASVVTLVPRRLLFDQAYDGDRQYDGLMGEDYLRRYQAVVDCARLALYLNTVPAKKLNLGPGLTQAGWTKVPMTSLQNDFVVPCEINGHRFRMLVDTGSPFAVMDRGMLLGAKVAAADIPMHGGVIGSQAAEMGFVKLPAASFGDYRVANLQVVADPSSSRNFQDERRDETDGKVLGLLGGSFLAANHAIIDIGGGALYLKHGTSSR